jgi:hypothetical protein
MDVFFALVEESAATAQGRYWQVRGAYFSRLLESIAVVSGLTQQSRRRKITAM